MDKILGNVLGNDGVAKVVGDQCGEFVECGLKKVLGGGDQAQTEGSGGSGPMGDLLKLGSGDKSGGSGFDAGDALKLAGAVAGGGDKSGGGIGDVLGDIVGGGQKKDEGGLDVGNLVGGFFK